jgi:hypothetical protein
MTETIAIEPIDHIGIRVCNLGSALGFYRVSPWCTERRRMMSQSSEISME